MGKQKKVFGTVPGTFFMERSAFFHPNLNRTASMARYSSEGIWARKNRMIKNTNAEVPIRVEISLYSPISAILRGLPICAGTGARISRKTR
jgi:hypothetical protein